MTQANNDLSQLLAIKYYSCTIFPKKNHLFVIVC